jgi:ketosteroid isomerase-like protein
MNKMIWASLAVVVVSASACGSAVNEPAASAAAAPPASAAPANDQNVEQQVIGVVTDWIDAVPKRDTERIGQLLADDFVAILWDGKKRSKIEYLEELRSGKYAVESIAVDETQARVLGDMAIVTYYQSEKSKSAGLDSSGGSVWTDVLARRNGRWQVIAEHGSRF